MHMPATEPVLTPSSSTGPVPLVIGVTGHRDLLAEETDSLRKSIRLALTNVQKTYPQTPLVLLSGLAEGADRFAAEVALELGMKLIAVLPREASSYQDDFQTDVSRSQFNDLLHRASGCVVMPATADHKGYVAQGAWLALHSHAVLALWDGKEGDAGGTASIVRLCREGIPPRHSAARKALDPHETRPVWWIRTRRQSEKAPPIAGAAPVVPGVIDLSRSQILKFGKMFDDTDLFNRTAIARQEKTGSGLQKSRDYLIPSARRQTLPASLQQMIEQYAQADTLAGLFQKRLVRCLDLLLGSIFLMGLTLQLRTMLSIDTTGPFLFHILRWSPIVCFAVAIIAYYGERQLKYHVRYLDYRALAEGLRVQLFWAIGGTELRVADEYLSRYRGELDWIRRAIRAGCLAHDSSPTTIADAKELLMDRWIDDQANFFARSAARQERLPRWVGLAWNVALVFGFVVAILRALPSSSGGFTPGWPLITIGLAVFALGLIKLRIKILALPEQAKQYQRMAGTFDLARTRLRAGADEQLILRELGRAALHENTEWLLMHRERPLELPKA